MQRIQNKFPLKTWHQKYVRKPTCVCNSEVLGAPRAKHASWLHTPPTHTTILPLRPPLLHARTNDSTVCLPLLPQTSLTRKTRWALLPKIPVQHLWSVAFDEARAVIINPLACSYKDYLLCGSCVEPREASSRSRRCVASSAFPPRSGIMLTAH